jgi:hypothetical protein
MHENTMAHKMTMQVFISAALLPRKESLKSESIAPRSARKRGTRPHSQDSNSLQDKSMLQASEDIRGLVDIINDNAYVQTVSKAQREQLYGVSKASKYLYCVFSNLLESPSYTIVKSHSTMVSLNASHYYC